MKIAVIIPAAGASRRFTAAQDRATVLAAGSSKIEQDLVGRPVFLRSIELFLKRPAVVQIILAVNPDTIDDFKFRWGEKLAFHGVTLVAGGRAERWETVARALEAVDPACTHAAVHDAARPLASGQLIDRVLEAAAEHPAVIPGLPVSNTLKRVAAGAGPGSEGAAAKADPLAGIGEAAAAPPVKHVVQTVDRADLVEVQTPQVFELGLLRRAYAQITEGKINTKVITDDAGLIEALGQTVVVVEGEATNFKITRPDDLKLAAAFVAATQQQVVAAQAKSGFLPMRIDAGGVRGEHIVLVVCPAGPPAPGSRVPGPPVRTTYSGEIP